MQSLVKVLVGVLQANEKLRQRKMLVVRRTAVRKMVASGQGTMLQDLSRPHLLK